ncbi:hypothetical protein H6784_04665 [Candidatus Nomurabacteria bacterium]|nr:hypothetical protein [Candidatus Kaiserbacteria bacterium]MCB9814681.1 hypothetical protein [Candidatus Nomurabacteria bacterium]
MKEFQAFHTHKDLESPEHKRQIMYALIGAVMLALPQKADALEFPNGTDWYDGIKRIEMTANHEDNEWSYLYLKTKSSGAWISPQEHSKNTGQIEFDETVEAAQKDNSEKSIERICIGHTHPTSNNITPGPSYIDVSQLPKFVNYVNELSEGPSSVFSDHVSVAGMMADTNGIWYYEGYNPELVAKNIASEIEPERIELINTVRNWLDRIVNDSQPNTTFNELRILMSDKGHEIDTLSPEQIANTLWEMVEIIPEANNFEVGKTFGLLMKDGVIGESVNLILKTMAKKIANVSTRATSNLAFEIRDYAAKLDGNEKTSYLQTELPKLVKAYENFYGTKVNFLTHEESQKAPPCPPIDYRPQQ